MFNSTHTGSFAQRQSVGHNKAEDLFEEKLDKLKISFNRFGFDEKKGFVPNFWQISATIRSLPDYVVFLNSKNCYFHIKGTNKIKLHDIMNYYLFQSLFCNKSTPLYLGILAKNKEFYLSFNTFIKTIKDLKVKSFDNDGKMYFEIPFDVLEKNKEEIFTQ